MTTPSRDEVCESCDRPVEECLGFGSCVPRFQAEVRRLRDELEAIKRDHYVGKCIYQDRAEKAESANAALQSSIDSLAGQNAKLREALEFELRHCGWSGCYSDHLCHTCQASKKALALSEPPPVSKARLRENVQIETDYRKRALAELWVRLPLELPGYHETVGIVQDSMTAALDAAGSEGGGMKVHHVSRGYDGVWSRTCKTLPSAMSRGFAGDGRWHHVTCKRCLARRHKPTREE